MKDPAFLFYSSDFLSGTMLMTDEEIGQYIKLLCLQHQKGHLKEKDMLNICKSYDEDIFSKFKKDEEGNYYNERLEEEIIRRKNYSESRRNNRLKKNLEEEKQEEKETYEKDMNNICNSYEEHMGTETETINKNININVINNKKDNRGMGEEGKEEIKNKRQFIVNIYNNICTNLPQVLKLTDKRNKAIDKFIKEFTEEQFEEICKLANNSSFLTGKNDRNWKADFDFIMRTDKALEILEGKYTSIKDKEKIEIMSYKENTMTEEEYYQMRRGKTANVQ